MAALQCVLRAFGMLSAAAISLMSHVCMQAWHRHHALSVSCIDCCLACCVATVTTLVSPAEAPQLQSMAADLGIRLEVPPHLLVNPVIIHLWGNQMRMFADEGSCR